MEKDLRMKQTTSSEWIEWVPAYDGHSPVLKKGARVQYHDGYNWDEPRTDGIWDWFRGCRYRFPATDLIGHSGGPPLDPLPSLPEDADTRNSYPMAEGLLDYFPNALAEVSRLSHAATQQHHPDQDMHWDRSKSKDHANKILRHLVDRGKLDDKGQRHSTMVAWRALALLQEELERDTDVPPSRASRNA
jgi:hypothetical protein